MANIAAFTDQQEHIVTSSILCSWDIQVFSTFSPPSCDKSSPDCVICQLWFVSFGKGSILAMDCGELATVQMQTL